MNIIRTIKLRSVENAIYTPSYNRLSFSVSEDDMSTDLSKSYLAMNLILVNKETGAPIAGTTLNNWSAVGLNVAFGNDGDSYSPAAIIKTARLIAKGGGQILEEIQFSNVLSQTLYQLTHDRELVESMSILYAGATNDGMGSSFSGSVSSLGFVVKNNVVQPLQVHIPLSDIFGCCKNNNFHLSQTKGLIFQLELEDNLNLFHFVPTDSTVDPNTNMSQMGELGFTAVGAPGAATIRLPPNDVTGDMAGKLVWYPTAETQVLKPKLNQTPDFKRSQVNSTHDGLRITNNSFLSKTLAEDFEAPGSTYFEPVGWGTGAVSYWGEEGQAVGDRSLRIKSTAGDIPTAPTAAQLEDLGFVVGAVLKLTWRVVDISVIANQGSPVIQAGKRLEEFVNIITITADGDTALIATDSRMTYSLTLGAAYAPILDAVEIMSPTANGYTTMMSTADRTIVQLDALTDLRTLVMNANELMPLIQMGLFTFTGGPIDGNSAVQFHANSFGRCEVGVEMLRTATGTAGTDGGLCVAPYVSNEGTNAAQLTSSGVIRLPVQGKGVKVVSVTGPVDELYAVVFSDLGLTPFKQPIAKAVPQWTQVNGQNVFASSPATHFRFYVFGATSIQGQINTGEPFIDVPLSYSIDRFELVLVQQSKSPKMPMAKLYGTCKMEPAAIENDQDQYQRQFIVSDGSCYNIALFTPEYVSTIAGKSGSLISRRRGIGRYRWQVNNVDATNRDIIIQDVRSDYPSSLHRDKLTDWFTNSDMTLMNLEGITPLAMNPEPVSILPLKVYSGVVGNNYIVNPASYTAQLVLYADGTLERKIKKGPVFLWKFCIREFPMV